MNSANRGTTQFLLALGKSRKHPRLFWNIFCVIFLCLMLVVILEASIEYVEYTCLETYHVTYLDFADHELITDSGTFKLPNNMFVKYIYIERVKAGDQITIFEGKITKRITKVYFEERPIFLRKTLGVEGWWPIIALGFIILPLPIFMLILVNTKHPGKRIRLWQREIGIWN